MPSVTEIQLNKLYARFRARFAPMIASRSIYGETVIISLARIKRENVLVLSMFNYISVTDGIKINDQYNQSSLLSYRGFEAIHIQK